MSNKVCNEDVPYNTIIRVLLEKIKSQEEEIEKLKKDNIEKNICKVIKEFKKSLNLTQHQILQLKLNPYYLSQVRENLNLKNQINKLKRNEK